MFEVSIVIAALVLVIVGQAKEIKSLKKLVKDLNETIDDLAEK